MIETSLLGIVPPPDGTPAQQAREALRLLGSRLEGDGRDGGHVLALTFFVDATDPPAYRSWRGELLTLVGEVLGPEPPPATVVGGFVPSLASFS